MTLLSILLALAAPAQAASSLPDLPSLVAAVRATETAFAQSMAARDFTAFTAFFAEDAVFINGGNPLRGIPAIQAHWQRFFAPGSPAPFSWQPEIVEVLPTGALAYTEGPVSLPDGTPIARFFSIWRRDPDGAWKIVFDNGYPLPPRPAEPASTSKAP